MTVTLEQFGLESLPQEQRLDLLELLWDSLDQELQVQPPAWHLEEVERRLATEDPKAGVLWEDFKDEWLKGS